ncbi:MAG TPA: hypothetical protein VK324_07835 [Tepidisphaeraceae bacterium]|nr:hypothetical protein [Tepidisphaeraceae bacterium]
MTAAAAGIPHVRFDTLDAARQAPDAVAVMEGDYGGQIYFTCPVRHIRCTPNALKQLLDDLDESQWCDPGGAGLYYEVGASGSGVAGGMGGGAVIDGVWLHRELEHLRSQVEEVIAGTRTRVETGGSAE